MLGGMPHRRDQLASWSGGGIPRARDYAISASADLEVRVIIQKFYDAFNDGFVGPADYEAEDCSHINPTGGRTQGRDAICGFGNITDTAGFTDQERIYTFDRPKQYPTLLPLIGGRI